ncbi:MAG: SulP family inorganic anion transporter, partial [Bacteroidota bacterium]
INWTELLLALITIVIIYGFKRITKAIPSTLVALVLVSGGAYLMELDYVNIQKIPSGYPVPHMEIFSHIDLGALAPYLVSALLLAMLGAIDSLLTSVVADNLTRTQHDPNRELVGQGIGNSIAAVFGGLPGAGATIRTVVNIQAGGKTKISGMIAGVLLFIIIMFLGPIASQIPAAVLAGILITVGIGVMDYKGLKAFPKMETSEKVIMVTVLLLTVFWQLVYAVGIGLVMAALVFLKRMSDITATETSVTDLSDKTPAPEGFDDEPVWEDEKNFAPEVLERVVFKHISGPMFFGFVSHFRYLVTNLPEIDILVIRFEKVPFLDQSGLYAVETAIEELYKQNVLVVLSGTNDQVLTLLNEMNVVGKYLPEKFVFQDFEDCRAWLEQMIAEPGVLEAEKANLKLGGS